MYGGTASPNPDYPQIVHNVSGSNEFKIQSKNLFPAVTQINGTDIVHARCTVNVNNGIFEITASGNDSYFGEVAAKGTAWPARYGYLIDVSNVDSITVKLSNTLFTKNFITRYDKNKISLGYRQNFSSTFTQEIDEETKYISIRFGYANTVAGTTYETTVQIEQGTTATDYVEHQEQNLPLDLRSKNLLIMPNTSITTNNVTSVSNNGKIEIKGTPNQNYFTVVQKTDFSKPLTAGTYTFSRQNISTTARLVIRLTFTDGSTKSYYMANGSTQNLQITTTLDAVSYNVYSDSNSTSTNLDFTDYIMLEEGSTATDYVPYYNYELSKIDTAEDFPFKAVNGDKYYDSLTEEEKNALNYGKWYIHKETGKEVFDGTDVFNVNIQEHVFYKEIEKMIVSRKPVITNLFKYRSTTTWSDLENYEICTQGSNKYIFIRNYDCNNLSDFYNLLALKNLIVYYVLATPTNTEITETPLINQLEAIRKAKSYNEQTNISQTNEDLPFILDIEALKK